MASMTWSESLPKDITLSNNVMNSENPKTSFRLRLVAISLQISSDVDAESTSTFWTELSMNITSRVIGFLFLVAINSNQHGGWVRAPFLKVRFRRPSQYGAYPGGPLLMKARR